MKRELIDKINGARDPCFSYPFCFGSSARALARHVITQVHFVYTDVPGMPNVLPGRERGARPTVVRGLDVK